MTLNSTLTEFHGSEGCLEEPRISRRRRQGWSHPLRLRWVKAVSHKAKQVWQASPVLSHELWKDMEQKQR